MLRNSKTDSRQDVEALNSTQPELEGGAKPASHNKDLGYLQKHPDWCVLVSLLFVQIACFLPICFQVGFYLDDWLTFWNLHFAPHNPIDLIKASFSDPRMVTRPVQCLYYGISYFFFADRPLPYHLLRCALEFLGVACLYLGLLRLSGQRIFATLGALFFILYPNHDATHYWIGAGLGPGFGLSLYLASFYLLIESAKAELLNRRLAWYFGSLVVFALSAFCYESFLPMLSLSFCALTLSYPPSDGKSPPSLLKRTISSLLYLLPFVLVALCEPVYQRVLLPRISKTFLSPSTFDLNYFLSVFPAAANVSFGPGFFNFCFERARDALISISPLSAFQAVGTVIAAIAALLISEKTSKDSSLEQSSSVIQEGFRSLPYIVSGALVFVCSYLTFAVAQGYTPVLDTMLNRVNIGGSVAMSIIFAALVCSLLNAKSPLAATNWKLVALTLPFVIFFALADLGLSAFWICSWEVQKNTRFLIQKHADQIKAGDSIILAHIHRYLMWAPVFDGTWDFQSMLRMTLNRNDVQGGVISDRLSIQGTNVVDNSLGYVCASYPADRIIVLFPSAEKWLRTATAAGFVEAIEENKSQLLLEQSTFDRWRANLSNATRSPSAEQHK